MEVIEIPFGAKDSELKGWEYTIPEGFTAEIKGGKVIVKEKESEDERIRKALIDALSRSGELISILKNTGIYFEDAIAYLERQKEQKPVEWDELQEEFRNINEAFEDGKKEVVTHPKKYGLCKPVEWSEEDEGKMEQCIRIVSGWEGDYDIVKSPYSNFLKSLRLSWKPSEEQMEALSDTLAFMPDTFKPKCTLVTLQNDLKKQYGTAKNKH